MILYYLVQHNHLYHDLTINHSMIESWSEEFISSEIADNIICFENSDHYEHEEYIVSLQSENYKNDFQAAQDELLDTDDQNSLIISSVYTDVNEEQIDSNLRLINALLEVITVKSSEIDETTSSSNDQDESVLGQRDLSTISYVIYDQAALMSS